VDRKQHAWQYVDWLFDGDDIIYVSRTGWDDSHNFHDANYMTFHRLRNFRDQTPADSTPWLGTEAARIETGSFTASGYHFEKGTLDDDQLAYANRPYVWKEVPERFRGWGFTKTFGGETADIEVTAKEDATLYMMTAAAQEGIDTSGWEPAAEEALYYTDGGKTRMTIFQRALKQGESLRVPQGNWTGGILIYPQ
jgi:hypothetical protein